MADDLSPDGADGPVTPIQPVPVDEAEPAATPPRWWQYRVCGVGRASVLQGESCG